jgi:hypothetical protein
MGWANCGEDSKGRPIGYAHSAICDHPECDKAIDRGLSYACGGMHGDDCTWCENYFCGGHLVYCERADQTHGAMVCQACCRLNCAEERDE